MTATRQPATTAGAVTAADLDEVDRHWRAANYLAAGQLYLDANPVLHRPLEPGDIKPRVVGHWGTVPGLNLVYTHINRAIRDRDRDVVFVAGPGHGGPALLAETFLEGSLGERDPLMRRDAAGMLHLFRSFSTPGGIPSHAAPNVPGSINEGGELGYSLAHAFGAVFDAPDALAVCVIGDGEAETGPLATAWHGTAFLDPVDDGAVLPVLHLNGYKIAGPTVLARMPASDLHSLLNGYGYAPVEVSGDDPVDVHAGMAAAVDDALDRIDDIQSAARSSSGSGAAGPGGPPRWPMIVLRTPKGWTGPSVVDDEQVEGTFRAHQVPLALDRDHPEHIDHLERWLMSYRPRELFDDEGRPTEAVLRCIPEGDRRMGANPRANAGAVREALDLPDPRTSAPDVSPPDGTGAGSAAATAPGGAGAGEPRAARARHSPTEVLGPYLRDVIVGNSSSFRIFSPDELDSNRLSAVFEATDRVWSAQLSDRDVNLAPHGRVMETLSEHQCEGWLEGYLLTGRHGLLATYEAFAHIIDSMVGQYAKWLASARETPWRRAPASLNILLTSHAWRQDHNGFTHQDPGFIDLVMNKDPEFVRVLFPPDANSLLCVADRVLREPGRINVVVAGKHPSPDYLPYERAYRHCERGIDMWPWAGSGATDDPDVVLACAGEVPARETLAAAELLAGAVPELNVRVVNVVDLLRLAVPAHDPRGLPDDDFDALFTRDRPVVFAFHGYPSAIHRLTYRRACHAGLHVHGYRERGTTTTPFDMLMLNGMDRYSLARDALQRAASPGDARAISATEEFRKARDRARDYTRTHGVDHPDVT